MRLAGACTNPIRLRGFYQRVAADTGELLFHIGSTKTGYGILVVSCNDRRASHCPVCARLYEKDAYHLIAAGLRGGKSVPPSVGSHPAVMLTLTAPSFGAVHGNRGQSCACGRRHEQGDPQIGAPIDPDCYRYTEQVIWNHYAPELWKRTVQALRRGLAHALDTPRSKLSEVAQLRFAKVAEFQRRGVVHYHAVIRIDGPKGNDTPPPAQCTTQLLEEIAEAAAQAAAVTLPNALASLSLQTPRRLRWGSQREIVPLDPYTSTMAAGYIAKYATKATEVATGGTLIEPVRSRRHLEQLELTGYARALVSAAWALAEQTGQEGFKRWAHQFGYGGHTLTKSRQYSVTFAALRAARAQWRGTANGEPKVIVQSQLAYAGHGRPDAGVLAFGSHDVPTKSRTRAGSQA